MAARCNANVAAPVAHSSAEQHPVPMSATRPSARTMHDSPTLATSVVTLVFLARLRDAFGASHERFEVAGPTTVGAIRERLRARGGAYASELAEGRAVRAAVNHELAGEATRVAPGDEVAFFPPVTGG